MDKKVTFRLDKATYERFKAKAKNKDMRSMTNQMIILIQKYLAEMAV
jgi:hypothetical protein